MTQRTTGADQPGDVDAAHARVRELIAHGQTSHEAAMTLHRELGIGRQTALRIVKAAIAQMIREQANTDVRAWIAETRASLARTIAERPPPPPKAERPCCGARCRDGHACKAAAMREPGASEPRNGRCRNHGGASTGPRTAEGKASIASANRRRAMRATQPAPAAPDDSAASDMQRQRLACLSE